MRRRGCGGTWAWHGEEDDGGGPRTGDWEREKRGAATTVEFKEIGQTKRAHAGSVKKKA